jgi:hypothetical protein
VVNNKTNNNVKPNNKTNNNVVNNKTNNNKVKSKTLELFELAGKKIYLFSPWAQVKPKFDFKITTFRLCCVASVGFGVMNHIFC